MVAIPKAPLRLQDPLTAPSQRPRPDPSALKSPRAPNSRGLPALSPPPQPPPPTPKLCQTYARTSLVCVQSRSPCPPQTPPPDSLPGSSGPPHLPLVPRPWELSPRPECPDSSALCPVGHPSGGPLSPPTPLTTPAGLPRLRPGALPRDAGAARPAAYSPGGRLVPGLRGGGPFPAAPASPPGPRLPPPGLSRARSLSSLARGAAGSWRGQRRRWRRAAAARPEWTGAGARSCAWAAAGAAQSFRPWAAGQGAGR